MLKYALIATIALSLGVGIGIWIGDTPPVEQAVEASATYRCPMHPTVVSDHEGSCPICGMDLVKDAPQGEAAASGERKVAYWRAPMDPSFITDKPGKSPMGMDLVPVYEDELAAEGTVTIDPVTVQNIGVRTATVEQRPFRRTIRTVGRVDYDETRMTDVNTKVTGWVERLYVDYTGQEIRKGQQLLEIYSPELVAAQEEYLTALDYHRRLAQSAPADIARGARELLNATARRLRYWDITDAQIAELEESRQVKRTMTIHSPQRGVVTHKAVHEGAHIKSGQHLYRIAELDRVWIYADVYEYELPWVKVGQHAEVALSYLPGKTFSGQVTYIFPYLEPKTRTVKVRMVFDNKAQDLKPDMYANVKIHVPVTEEALVVPTQALIHSGERHLAIVSLGDGKFQPREVEPGAEADGYYQILKGLHQGERIVTSAQFLIDSESNLKAAFGKMGGTPEEGEGSEHQGHEGMETQSSGTNQMAEEDAAGLHEESTGGDRQNESHEAH